MLVWILGSVQETKPWCAMAFPGRREERAQRRLTSSPSGKKLHHKCYISTILQQKRNKDILEESTSAKIKKRANSVTGWWHCALTATLGLGVKSSAMSPTLQLSTFIKRLRLPSSHTGRTGAGLQTGPALCPVILCQWLALHFNYSFSPYMLCLRWIRCKVM